MRLVWDSWLHFQFAAAALGVHVFCVFDCPFGVHLLGQPDRLDGSALGSSFDPLVADSPRRRIVDVVSSRAVVDQVQDCQLRTLPDVEPSPLIGCAPLPSGHCGCRAQRSRSLSDKAVVFGFAGTPPNVAGLCGERLLPPLKFERGLGAQPQPAGCLTWVLLEALEAVNYQGSYQDWWLAAQRLIGDLPIRVQLLGSRLADPQRELVFPIGSSEHRAFNLAEHRRAQAVWFEPGRHEVCIEGSVTCMPCGVWPM